MASASGSRTGLITATVVLTIVAVTALVFASIFFTKANRASTDLDALTKSYNDVVKRNALSGTDVTALKERRSAGDPFTSSDPLLSVAIRERDDLAKLAGGQTAQAAEIAAKAALAEAAAKLKAAGLPEVSTTEDMAGTVKALSNSVATLSAQVADLTKAANAAKAQQAKTIEDTSAQLAEKDKTIEGVRAEAAKATDEAAKDRAARQATIDDINKNVEASSKAMADAQQQLANKAADLERARARLEKDLLAARQKISLYRPDAQQSILRQADGSIARIVGNDTVYIDLGAGDQIVPGMTFEIYDKTTGVPPLKNDDTTLPAGKGSIEVIRVSPNSSECRIVKRTTGRTITEGDIIANLIYDHNTKYNFVVAGKFDLSKSGSPDAADAAILKRLVTQWGGNVQDTLTVNTDFLVIGSEPKIPDFSEEQRRDPVNAKILSEAQAELDNYNATLNRAKDLYIPVLNQNRFLYYIGYFDQKGR